MLALGCLPAAVRAWGSLILLEPPPQTDSLSMGASYWRVPRSPDGIHADRAVLPAFDYERHDGIFVSTETGLGYNASQTDQWQAGVRLWPQFGRSRQDSSAELPRIGPRMQGQGYANLLLADVVLVQSAISAGSGQGRGGVQAEWGLSSAIPWSTGMLGVGAAATLGNRVFRRDYTGVDQAGWTDWSWTLSLDQKLSGPWHMDGQWQRAQILRHGANGASGDPAWHPSALLLSLWRDW
ncbi:MipA/OmpV family protein [Ideonella sp. B508-1]|uniref:MipA/OmpV family protein n=1 Tax=Ideonella sp. B508-1 TaxID=137716 RepID=UPI0003B3CEEC|nr:MipA/OmpV family protein [Ideonella sp. B508-1]